MPLYDYDCTACGRRIEVVHGVHAPAPTHCPNCGGGPLKKAITAPAVHFKGSGWAKKERRATVAPGASKTSEGSGEGSGDGGGEGTASKEPDTSGSSSGGSSDKSSDPTAAASKPSSATSGSGTATKTD